MKDFTQATTHCRACGSASLRLVLDLGTTPLADRLVSPERAGHSDPTAPLKLIVCESCTLAQLSDIVPPRLLFDENYPYYSSVSPSLLRHFENSAEQLVRDHRLSEASLVIEAASNDGYFLKNFHAAGIPVLGIDPSTGPAKRAQAAGIPTRIAFLDTKLARELRDEGIQADLFLANNVLAHVPEIRDFIAAISMLLQPRGRAVFETPYLLDLVDKTEFDTIYHQHVFYYSVHSLSYLFGLQGLVVNSVEKISIHGGSLRIRVSRDPSLTEPSVEACLRVERERGIRTPEFFSAFGERVAQVRRVLPEYLARLRAEGARVAGYGAAAKATTLLSFCGIGRDHLDYIVDKNEMKHGLFMSGNRIPILPREHLTVDQPEYLLVLAWNFADEIIRQEASYAALGGRFIVPLPKLEIR
jgi:SAM-dependent methyltransferase